jgi:hypothetical protein
MKKLMLIVAVLMIAGGISAHGYYGYRGCGYHEVVVARPYYAPAPYYGGCGYRPVVVYHGGCGYHGGYRGYRR